MRRVVALGLGLLCCAAPVSVHGWGMDVHRFLTRRAIDGLPLEIRAFFAARRDFISEHAVDPDLWRVVGLKGELGTEDPNHFLDIDGLGDPPPFRSVPRDWNAFVAKYGIEKANQHGRLPWRAEEIYKRLVATFRDVGQSTRVYAPDNAQYLAAVLSHYVEDAHVPFHAVVNHDGQLTNQQGIHARFENNLVLRNLSALKLAPVTIRPIVSIRDFMFATLVESQSLAATVLEADRRAAGGRQVYDDAYYAALLSGARGVVEKRLSDAASAVASAIVSAWTDAGKPPLPLQNRTPRSPTRR